MFTYLWDDPAQVPAPLPMLVVGAGKRGFIGHVAHVPALRALQTVFDLRWAAPSRDQSQCDLFRAHTGLPKKRVGTDYEQLLRRGFADNPVVGIYTDTPQHAKQMIYAMGLGVAEIVVDKPAVTSMAEYNTVAAAADRTAIYVTFNHVWNPAVFQLRQICRDAGPEGIEMADAWFLQPWCCEFKPLDQPGGKQQNWRLSHLHGAALDIETHIGHLASFVLDSPIVSVSSGQCRRQGKHGRPCLDSGTCALHFNNRVVCQTRYSNATPGYQDDIGVAVAFRKGKYAGKKVMWRLVHNAGDTLIVGSKDANPMQPFGGGWTDLIERGGGEFSDEVNQIFGFQPGGHNYAWTNFWQFLYLAVAGDIMVRRGLMTLEELPLIMRQPPPTFEDDGEMTQRLVHALDQSFVGNGVDVKLADVGDTYLATPPPEEERTSE